MFVTSISIRRQDYFGSGYGSAPNPDKPFQATVEVHGNRGKIELMLDPDMSKRIVALISEEIAAAGRATAEAMVADVLTLKALPEPVTA